MSILGEEINHYHVDRLAPILREAHYKFHGDVCHHRRRNG
jgi:hypothetical protein